MVHRARTTACLSLTEQLVRSRFLGMRAEQDKLHLGKPLPAVSLVADGPVLRPRDDHADEGEFPAPNTPALEV